MLPKHLRVLAVLSQRPGQTGSGVYLRELASQLSKLGHEVHLLAAGYEILTRNDFPQLPNEQIHTVTFSDKNSNNTVDLNFPISGMSLDMPYLHIPFRNLNKWMLEKYISVWISRIQELVDKIQPDIIHVNHLWLLPEITRLAAPKLPIIATAHGSSILLLQDKPDFSSLITPGINALDAIISVSQNLALSIEEIFNIPREKVFVIENGYNPHLFRVQPRNLVIPKVQEIIPSLVPYHYKKIVLFVGKFAAYKGLPYLLRAAEIFNKSLSGILTLIVGDGSRDVRNSLEDLVNQLQLKERVLLPGKLPYSKIGLVMNLADVFVLPSTYEGFGIVLLEALACGTRSVASDLHGPLTFVPKSLQQQGFVTLVKPPILTNDGQSNIIEEEEYVRALAKAIAKQLDETTSETERSLIANSIRGRDWPSQIKKTEQLYFKVISSKYTKKIC